jgi:CBS domain-containing protein
MKVEEIANSDVHLISTSAMASEAAQRMKKYDAGILPVLDYNNLVGVLTDRDILIRTVAIGKDPKMTTVKDIISYKVFFCSKDSKIQTAAQLMKNKQVRRLLVLGDDNIVVGMLSFCDLVLNTNDERLVYEVLKGICKPVETKNRI